MGLGGRRVNRRRKLKRPFIFPNEARLALSMIYV
jgi:hypothetical protein